MLSYGEEIDPLDFKDALWPDVQFYEKQIEIIYSVMNNDETFVPAGNGLGKDFTSAFIILWFFLTRDPCTVLTTSADQKHLKVLWGEMNWFIQNAKHPLDAALGGPLIIGKEEIRKTYNGIEVPKTYIIQMVANDQSIAKMGGHHAAPKIPDGIPHSLFVADEASSVATEYYKVAIPWANRVLVFGNTWPAQNFFREAVDAGDVLDTTMKG